MEKGGFIGKMRMRILGSGRLLWGLRESESGFVLDGERLGRDCMVV